MRRALALGGKVQAKPMHVQAMPAVVQPMIILARNDQESNINTGLFAQFAKAVSKITDLERLEYIKGQIGIGESDPTKKVKLLAFIDDHVRGLQATPFPLLSLPTSIILDIAAFTGGTQSYSGNPVATTPSDLVKLSEVNKTLHLLISGHKETLGLSGAAAIKMHADTPHHGLQGFENTYTPNVWPQKFIIHPDSKRIFEQRSSGNAFCGVANVRTGVIVLYPLAPDEEYKGGTAWGGGATFEGAQVVPIVHQGDLRAQSIDPEMVSHEILARLILRAPESDCVGFTLWSETATTGKVEFIWSSRGLNKQQFTSPGKLGEGGGHTTKDMAEHIVAACAIELRHTWRVI